MFGGGVDAAAGAADVAHLGRDVDDAAADFVGCHALGDGLCGEEGGAEVEVDDGVEVFVLDVEEVGVAGGSGVVDGDVQGAVGCDGRAHGGEVGDVHLGGFGAAAGSADGGGGLFDLGRGSGGEDDVGAGLGEGGGAGEADAAAGAGDEGAFAVEAEGGGLREDHSAAVA